MKIFNKLRDIGNRCYDCLSLKEFGKGYTKKEYLKAVFIREKGRMQKGVGESNSLRYPIQFVMIFALFAKDYLPDMHMTFYILLGVVATIGLWFMGFLWDVFRLYHEENEFGNRRNTFVKEMRRFRKNVSNTKNKRKR